MKCTVTNLAEENELVVFTNNILGNYSSKSLLGTFYTQYYPFHVESVTSQIENFSQTNSYRCVNIVELLVDNLVDNFFRSLYFEGSRSNDGVGVGCILVNINGKKTMLSYRLEFKCTNNVAEYEAFIQGLQKVINLDVKFLNFFGDSEIVVKYV